MNEPAPRIPPRIYPNPTNGALYLQELPVNAEVQAYNAQGVLVRSVLTSGTSLCMDLGEEAGGLYTIVIIGNGKSEAIPVILSR